MTTERPYHRALTLEQAFAEVRRGRGSQFAPEVVDAFFAAQKRRPGEFWPEQTAEPEEKHLRVVAGSGDAA
jgi:HD-GYP domain-containing protein (c-di-GMP phosphodiesterase class II)